MDEKGLGKRLQEVRKAAGFTQQQLCERANLSFSTLTKIERGAIRAPSIFTVQSIAQVLGMSLDELLGTPSLVKRSLGRTKSGASFIYFDVNGCLVHFFQKAFTKIANDANIPIDVVEGAIWHFNDDANRGVISLEDFNNSIAQLIGVKTVDWSAAYLAGVEKIQDMQDLLVWASQHYRVGLLTNSVPTILDKMIQHGILPQLQYDAIVDSSTVGVIKPDPRIYEIATERAGVSPSEILFIDDSRLNLIAAEKFGWHVAWFDDSTIEESVARARDALTPA